MFKLSWVFKY